jgi:ribosome-associated protein
MPLSEHKKPDPNSKSQAKRDMLALQKLGEELIDLSESQLAKIPLPPELEEAVNFARKMKANEARRRHLQYIGKLMRNIDPAPITTAIEKIKLTAQQNIMHFHKIEKWRDELITEGDIALERFLQLANEVDRQHLRQLVRNAQQERIKNKNTGAQTELFKYLRQILFK